MRRHGNPIGRRRPHGRAWILGATIVTLAMLSGCGPVRKSAVTYHDPGMDFSLVGTVAVMPFTNLTSETQAAPRVRDVFMTMLQATEAVYVLPRGDVARAVGRVGVVNPSEPDPDQVVELCRILEADVVITGTIREYGEARSGNAAGNLISMSVEMHEGQTGRVVWSASSTRGGVGAGDRLLGGGGRPMNTVTSDAVADLIGKLFD